MTVADLVQLVYRKLGDQTAFYTSDEIIRSGLAPAERLLCLVYPQVLSGRAALTVSADSPFIDLRAATANRLRRITRVVLGDVTADTATRAETGELTELRPVSLAALSTRRDWLSVQGEVRRYWLWGKCWLGLYKRPLTATTVTLIYDAAPVPLLSTNLAAEPSVQEVYHPAIAEIAAGLLLVKEGMPQGSSGLAKVAQALNLTAQNQGVAA